MTGQEIHLLINHLPVIGSVWTVLLLLAAAARPSRDLARIAFGSLVLAGALVIPVFLSGEPAEHSVEHVPGIVESRVEEHEDAGRFALGMAFAAIVGGAACWFWAARRPEDRKPVYVGVAVAVLLVMVLARTAYLGGRVHRGELGSQQVEEAH